MFPRIPKLPNMNLHFVYVKSQGARCPAVSALCVRSRKFNVRKHRPSEGCPKMYHLELLRTSEGTLSRWSRLVLQSLAPTNPHWWGAPRSVRLGVQSWKLSNVGHPSNGWPKMYHFELLRASEGTLSRWFRLVLQSLASTNPHWARVVVGYGPFLLCVIHKEDPSLSSGDFNWLILRKILT
jgi:hypothetical protein